MNYSIKLAALASVILGLSGAANATALVAFVPSTTVDTVAASFGGTLLGTAITSINNASYNGTARAAVYDTGTGLDFYYQFTNNLSSINGLERFTAFDFSLLNSQAISVFQTGAAFGIFAAGTEISDTADRTTSGVIGFNFVPNFNSKIEPGTTSYTQIIRTDARNFTSGTFGLLDGIGDNAAAFGVSAVPEPESYALFMVGLGLVAFAKLRRQKPAA